MTGIYDCPLCGIDFEGAACHSSCALSRGCVMVRCPNCGHEFVQDGKVAAMLKRFFGRRDDDAASSR